MSEQVKCPVCGKVGIPDYRKENVTCSCCGTDLSIYKMLADSQTASVSQSSNTNKWKMATAVSVAFAIALLVFLVSRSPEPVNGDELKEKVAMLNDSIQKIQSNLNSAHQQIEDLKQAKSSKSDYFYIVKKGDSPCLISRKLFGTEMRYKEIEAIATIPLRPGDTLYVKQK